MVFCCFRGGKQHDSEQEQSLPAADVPPATFQAQAVAVSKSLIFDDKDRVALIGQLQLQHTVASLRAALAQQQGGWKARLSNGAESVRAACSPAAHASLFGAAPCGTALVSLGSACPSAPSTLVAPGHVLSVPWPLGSEAHNPQQQASSSSSAGGHGRSGGLMNAGGGGGDRGSLGAGRRTCDSGVIVWQIPGPLDTEGPSGSHLVNGFNGLTKGLGSNHHHSNGNQQDNGPAGQLPLDWQEMLRSIGADLALSAAAGADGVPVTPLSGQAPMPLPSLVAMPPPSRQATVVAAGPPAQTATLVPVRLGSELVGAVLLVVSSATEAAAAEVAVPAAVVNVRASKQAATGKAGAAAESAAAAAAAAAAALQSPWSGELLLGLASAVAECCLGPHMADIRRVASAARDIATAPDVQGLASALSTAVAEALASDLHVDFTVRMALVPQAYGTGTVCTAQYGFMLTEQPSSATPPVLSTADALLGRGSNAPPPQPQGPPSRTAARLSFQQNAVDRLVALGGGKVSGGAASGAWDTAAALLSSPHGGGGSSQAAAAHGYGSGVHSFQLPGPWGLRGPAVEAPVRVWKARPFSLDATLLAALAGKAIRTPACGSATTGAGGGGGPHCSPAVTPGAACADDIFTTGAATTCAGGPTVRLLVPVGGLSSFAAASALSGVGGVAPGGGGAGGVAAGCRVGGTVVPHVHAFVHDTDQPSGDIVLLFRTGGGATGGGMLGGRGGGGGGGLGTGVGGGGGGMGGMGGGGGGGGGIAAAGPASLVLVAGCVALSAGDGSDVFASAAAAPPMQLQSRGGGGGGGSILARSRQGTGNGMIGAAGPSSGWTYWPAAFGLGGVGVGVGGDGGGGGEVSVCVALYLTSQERLPTSLLCAARNSAQSLLELLLPAASVCLSEAAYTELQFMVEAVIGPTANTTIAAAFAAAAAAGGGGSGYLMSRSPSFLAQRNGSRMENCISSRGGGPCTPPLLGGSDAGLLQPGRSAPVPGSSAVSDAFGTLGSGGGGGGGGGSGGGGIGIGTIPTLQSLRGGGGGSGSGGGGSLQVVGDGLHGGGPETTAAAGVGSGFKSRAGNADVAVGASEPATCASGGGGGGAAASAPAALSLNHPSLMPCGADTSENSPRVPRSRLSNTSAHPAGHHHNGGAMSQTMSTMNNTGGNAITNALLLSTNNSLIATLLGSASITGRNGIGGGGGGGDTALALAAAAAAAADGGGTLSIPTSPYASSYNAMPAAPRGTRQQQQQLSACVGANPQQTYSHGHSGLLGVLGAPPVMGAVGRGSGKMARAPRRQMSELLATMPCDVSDTLTVMRTNMDILVSSFWNTLRSQHTEAAPSPHADEDLRFLRLNKVLGGGGCSTVYAGLLHGLEVAVKVMNAPSAEEEEDAMATGGGGGGGVADGELATPSPAARRAQLRALMRGARELAVMTSISHPNIVQIYSYHTRVLVSGDEEQLLEAGDVQLPLLQPAPPGMDESAAPGPLQTVLIMECCDLGSLADALDSGMFANAVRAAEAARMRPAPPRRSHTLSQLPTIPARGSFISGGGGGGGGGAGAAAGGVATADGGGGGGGTGTRSGTGVAAAVGGSSGGRVVAGAHRSAGCGGGMRAVYMTLLEVALALRHMHSMQLVHCDVKPANVLLKSSASDPRGFTCKLTDFGFVNLLQFQMEDADNPAAKPSMRYHEPVGTVTHLAPETMVQGSKLDHTVDVYAFGILMWEVFTGKAPYAEYASNGFRDVPFKVVREGMRPNFPSATPVAFKTLAQSCWSHDPARRPGAAMLVASLQRLMEGGVTRG